MKQKFNKNFDLFYQNQDQKSFEKIYLVTSTQMFGVLSSICPSKECAQDCLQEGYIKLWRNINNFDSKIGKPLPWLMAIFRNQAIDVIRKNRAQYLKKDYLIHLYTHVEFPKDNTTAFLILLDKTKKGFVMVGFEYKTSTEIVEGSCIVS